MSFRQIAAYLWIKAESLERGICVYLWRESEIGTPPHYFESLEAAVAVYGNEDLDNDGRAVHINNESVVFWLE